MTNPRKGRLLLLSLDNPFSPEIVYSVDVAIPDYTQKIAETMKALVYYRSFLLAHKDGDEINFMMYYKRQTNGKLVADSAWGEFAKYCLPLDCSRRQAAK